MAHNPLPPGPPEYETSDAVRTAISLAYSSHFNPRGLEGFWYGAYAHVFADIASPYGGRILVHPQFPLSIPAVVVKEQQLQDDLAKAGLPWAAGDLAQHVNPGQVPAPADAPSKNAPATRRSVRVAEKLQRKAEESEKRKRDEEAALRRRQQQLVNEQLKFFETQGIVSRSSAASKAEKEAVTKQPDFVLSHVATVDLPNPGDDKQGQAHRVHRAGVKVFHYCSVLIAEVKKSPPRGRDSANEMQELEIFSDLEHAQTDLLQYCAVFFQRYEDAQSVIAFAAGGLYWQWSIVYRAEVPKLAWVQNPMFRDSDPQVEDFHTKFGLDYFVLGTEPSDAELRRIIQNQIHPLVHNAAHIGPAPQL
ncbi:hypothetical protein LshimejAT787_0904320 [Lyophyllum shimeji]|uniref:Uncharacterized protein n=1 Tax=Lyophyllum shimeji TaxID=47721 RepID=A0A9P3UQF3_LYOSH|nr:hypothetical protein LshimejAT787_0904320 [Lyophyllum shimeji]